VPHTPTQIFRKYPPPGRKEEMGSGIPQVAGSKRNRKNCRTWHSMWQLKKGKEEGANKNWSRGMGTGSLDPLYPTIPLMPFVFE